MPPEVTQTETEQTEWRDPFPKPSSYPSGWDMSSIPSRSNEQSRLSNSESWRPDPFPEPRTIPGGWNF